MENQRIWPAWAHISTDNCRLGPSSSLALREAWGRQFTLASHVPAVQVWGPWALAFSLWPRPEPLFASLWFLHSLLEFHQPPPSTSPFKQGFPGLGETGVISRVSCTGPTSCVQAAPRGCQSAFPNSNNILCEPSTPNENDQALPNSSLPGTTERAPQSIWRILCLAE